MFKSRFSFASTLYKNYKEIKKASDDAMLGEATRGALDERNEQYLH